MTAYFSDFRRSDATRAVIPTIPAPDDPEMLEQAVEVANENQEWEICDIIGREDVDGC